MLFGRRTLALVMTTGAVALLAILLAAGATPAGAATARAKPAARASAKGSARPNSAVEIGAAKVSGLGSVLVRGSGRPLYVFEAMGRSHPPCVACPKVWFPVLAPASGVAKAIGAAKQSLIGSVRDPVIGKRVVTYDGRPLYTYVLDKLPDVANGQDILMGGGYWRVLTPVGKVKRTAVSHGGGYVGS